MLLVLLFRVGVARELPLGGSITPPDWLDVEVCARAFAKTTITIKHTKTRLRKSIGYLAQSLIDLVTCCA